MHDICIQRKVIRQRRRHCQRHQRGHRGGRQGRATPYHTIRIRQMLFRTMLKMSSGTFAKLGIAIILSSFVRFTNSFETKTLRHFRKRWDGKNIIFIGRICLDSIKHKS